MNKYRYNQLLHILLFVLMSSCSDSSLLPDTEGVGVGSDSEVTVNFELSVPKTVEAKQAYALQSDKETLLETIDLLLFEVTASNEEIFSYHTHGLNLQSEGTKHFSARLRADSKRYRIVVLANLRSSIKEERFIGKEKSEVLKLIEFDTSTRWHLSDRSFKALPMWGETLNAHQIKPNATSNTFGVINMMRSVARIDVKIKGSVGETSQGSTVPFNLNKIVIANANSVSAAVPVQGAEGGVTEPTLVAGDVDKVDYTFDLEGSNELSNLYVGEAKVRGNAHEEKMCLLVSGEYNGSGKNSWYRIDFTHKNAESENQVDTLDILRNTLYNVVIKSVDGEGYDSKEEALNSPTSNMLSDVLPIQFTVVGNEVVYDGDYALGFPDKVECYADTVMNREIKVFSSDLKSPFKLLYLSSSPTEEIPLATNWIEVEMSEDEDLYFTGYMSKWRAKGIIYSIEKNDTGERRSAYIHVKIGRLHGVIEIIQEADFNPFLKLEVFNEVTNKWELAENIVFLQEPAEEMEEKSFRVCWQPATAEVKLEQLNLGNFKIQWDTANGLDNPEGLFSSRDGVKEFKIKPLPVSGYKKGSFDIGLSKILASFKQGGHYLMSSLKATQKVADLAIDRSSVILMDGAKTKITVKANVPWVMNSLKNRSDQEVSDIRSLVVKKIANYTFNASDMEAVVGNIDSSTDIDPFKSYTEKHLEVTSINDLLDPKIYVGELILQLTSPSGVQVDTSLDCVSAYKMDDMEANSYVLDPVKGKGAGILIPVRAANGIMKDKFTELYSQNTQLNDGGVILTPKISSNMKFGAKLVWTDTPTASNPKRGLGDDGLLSAIRPVGKGEDGHILVLPGNNSVPKTGNAVIAVTERQGEVEGEGDILWSWHIWVTDELFFKGHPMISPIRAGVMGIDVNQRGDEIFIMDMNLGATSRAPATPETYGVQYQWGRKDPFPVSNGVDTNRETIFGEIKTIYDAYGEIPFSFKREKVSIEETIKNPITLFNPVQAFLPNETPPYGFYSRLPEAWYNEINNNLWSGEKEGNRMQRKSIFDPCPAGYRLPIIDDTNGRSLYQQYRELEGLNGFLYGGSYLPSSGTIIWVESLNRCIVRNFSSSETPWYSKGTYEPEPFHGIMVERGWNRFMARNNNYDSYSAKAATHPIRCVKEY